jgi:hypothetical protein
MTQLDLIEPTGSELARLAAHHAQEGQKHFTAADIWELRSAPALVREFETLGFQCVYKSMHCLNAFEFEFLGGLQ